MPKDPRPTDSGQGEVTPTTPVATPQQDSTPAQEQNAQGKKTNPRQGKRAAQTAKKSEQPSALGLMVGLLIFAVVVVGAWAVWTRGLGVLAVAETILRVHTPLILGVLVPLLIAAYLMGRPGSAPKNKKPAGLPPIGRPDTQQTKAGRPRRAGAAALAGVVALAGAGYAFAAHPYVVAKTYTVGTITEGSVTSFADRAPWIVANNYAQRDQGDVIGDREDVHYVPAAQDAQATAGDGTGQGTSRYTVLVKERGVLGSGGYEAVQTLTMPTTGTIPASASSFCEVPEQMGRRLDTVWPWYSLGWTIHARAPFAHWDQGDIYGYCDGDSPVVVVPLYRYDGFWNVTKVPNGAAVYTPEGLEVLSAGELVEANLAGPTYPRSIATVQREAINAGGSITQWWGSKYGYDLTDSDAEDANAGNPSEFTMVSAGDGAMSYVSPLTPRGSSQSITALSLVPAVQDGQGRAPLTVNAATDLPATSTLVTAIKESSVQGDNAWTTRWSAGMSVYEILPAKDGHWVASIGQGQAVSYRADISPEGQVTVVNAETGQSSGGAVESTESVTVDGGKPLDQKTEAELVELIQQAAAELEKRQNTGN